MDLTSSNLQGINAKFNSILSKLEDTKSTAFANLETSAATATSAISADLSNLTTELRTLVPEGFSVPNVNLQAQLQSLSGLTDPTQSANLLADITSSFGSELTANGFNLDTLVTDAASVFGTDTSLSGLIPNFELTPAGDILRKASAVKLPSIDPVIEEAATFVSNTDFTAAKTNAINAVYTTFETLPTTDVGVFKISDKFKKITQSSGGINITKELTTPILAFQNSTRKTISSKGFTNRVFTITEKFTISDMEKIEGDNIVTLKYEPIKIIKVLGKTITSEKIKGISTNRFQLLNFFNLGDILNNTLQNEYKKDIYSIYPLNNKQVVIKEDYRQYDGTPWAIRITYRYNETYDPTFAKPETLTT